MPKLEKYLRLDPDGTFTWITIDRDDFFESLHEAIDCDCVEHVNLMHAVFEALDPDEMAAARPESYKED